ncbi:MAG TPA: magnesium/cobalt transporter CorA [Polyangiaceae bacterium]|jgi:magnesium transporter
MRAFILEGDALSETTDLAAVRAAVEAKKTMWIDLEAQSPEVDALLEGPLGLHPLTIEDIWSDRPSPKADEFPTYLYVCAHTVKRSNGDLHTCEVDLVVGASFVVTHDATGIVSAAVRDDLKRSPRLLMRGAPWVAHTILDRLVDGYLPVIDAFDDDVEALEDDVLAKAGTPEGGAVLGRILALKRSLQSLRRVSIHQRELLLRLARGEFAIFPPDVLPYLRDVHDHFVRVGDLADSYRDLVTSALDAYLSVQSNRMNEVMKTLTLISTVMLPLTFIAGVYGMNFDHMPELHWRYGYPFALGLMAVVALAAVLWFRHKRWIA